MDFAFVDKIRESPIQLLSFLQNRCPFGAISEINTGDIVKIKYNSDILIVVSQQVSSMVVATMHHVDKKVDTSVGPWGENLDNHRK